MLALSSNGTAQGSAVLWTTIPKSPKSGDANQATVQGSFIVYDATAVLPNNQLKQLFLFDYNYLAKFSPPVVANGKVYVATFDNSVLQFGL